MPPLKDFLAYTLAHQKSPSNFESMIGSHTRVYSHISGVVCFIPTDEACRDSNKHIVLSSGVHGNETAPIEICNSMIADIASGAIRVAHPVMFIFGNIPAIEQQTRFIEENLNRLFSPEITAELAGGTNNAERKRAVELMQAVSDFFQNAEGERHHYDLHTAIRDSKNEKFAVYPYLHGSKHAKCELQFMSDCGVNTVLLSQSSTATFSYYSSFHHHAHTFTVELGKVMPFGQNDMARFAKANTMFRRLIQEKTLALTPYELCPLILYEVNQTINKHYEDFRLHFADDLANFTTFKKGELLASESTIRSDGSTHKIEYRAEHDGEAIVFPNADVAIGQRAMLTLVPCVLD